MTDMHFVRPVDRPEAGLPSGAAEPSRIGGRTLELPAAQALVVTKLCAGLPEAWVRETRAIVRGAGGRRQAPLKFLALDLGEGDGEEAVRGESADLLIGDIANLVLHAPVVTVAYARGRLAGEDLELALACSMLVCEEDATFSFAADPTVSVAKYALLAQKIGFVRAERLMEREEVLSAAQMRDFLLVKETTAAGSGLRGLEQFLVRAARRHNSAAAIYRAQRIATPMLADFFGEPTPN